MKERVGDGKLIIIIISVTVSSIDDHIRFYSRPIYVYQWRRHDFVTGGK